MSELVICLIVGAIVVGLFVRSFILMLGSNKILVKPATRVVIQGPGGETLVLSPGTHALPFGWSVLETVPVSRDPISYNDVVESLDLLRLKVTGSYDIFKGRPCDLSNGEMLTDPYVDQTIDDNEVRRFVLGIVEGADPHAEVARFVKAVMENTISYFTELQLQSPERDSPLIPNPAHLGVELFGLFRHHPSKLLTNHGQVKAELAHQIQYAVNYALRFVGMSISKFTIDELLPVDEAVQKAMEATTLRSRLEGAYEGSHLTLAEMLAVGTPAFGHVTIATALASALPTAATSVADGFTKSAASLADGIKHWVDGNQPKP